MPTPDLTVDTLAQLIAAGMKTDVGRLEHETATAVFSAIDGVLTALTRGRDEAIRERDLAIAHDRQPYPTADAYKAACRALEKHRQIADEATAALVRSSLDVEEAERLRRRFETPIPTEATR